MTVFSRFHLLRANTPIESDNSKNGMHIMLAMEALPAFVVQNDAIEMLTRSDCIAAVHAMIDANILKLPYPDMRLEWQIREAESATFVGTMLGSKEMEPIHEFVRLREVADGAIECTYAFYFCRSGLGAIYEDTFTITPDKGDWKVAYQIHTNQIIKDLALGPCMLAIQMALVLMNMKGIDREVHEFPALNKARVKKGKPSIAQYSYVRIGHVYKADGSRVKYTAGDHRHMPMHIRSAHTRRQHFGKENSEVKIIYVPSCIVNFNPGEEMKAPKQRIVKA